MKINRFNRLNTHISNIQQKRYTTVGGATGTGKTAYVDSAYLFHPYEYLKTGESKHSLEIIYWISNQISIYGQCLLNLFYGAPLRIFIPWKYGFKSAKAIVKIKLVEKMPTSSWMRASPREYGFYSNVNPNVDHPRWSQATERVIGDDIFAPRAKTLMSIIGKI